MPIESFLTPSLAWRVAVEAAHSALKAIAYRDGSGSFMEGLRRQAADNNQAAGITLRILEEIEKDAERPIAALSDTEAEHYGRRLSALVDQRIAAENVFDRSSADDTLADLRAEFGKIG